MTERYADQARPDAGLFIDWDNLKLGLKDLGRQPNISSLLDAVGQRGRIVIARAYADWQQKSHAFDPPNLYAAGIEPVYVPIRMHSGQLVKNSADVKLAVDCIDFLNTAPHLKTFFLVSGDSDLLHLVNFLRARGKRVIVVAVSHTLSPTLADNLDELMLYDVDIEPARQPEVSVNGQRGRATTGAADTAAVESRQLEEAFSAVADLLRTRSNRVGSLFSWIGIQLARRGIDYKALGFERFKDFMQEAERRGNIRILTRGLQDWAYLPEQYEHMTETELAAEEQESNEDSELQSVVAVQALDPDAQRHFLRYLVDLENRSEYLIPPYIVSHLIRDSVLPSLSQSQLRSLVRDAIDEEILVPSTYTVPHRTTGKPYELRTVRLNPDHPLVRDVMDAAAVASGMSGDD